MAAILKNNQITITDGSPWNLVWWHIL